MSKVNFVDEFNLFMRFARDNNLSLRERALWMALFYIANDRAVYDVQTKTYDWSDGFICVSNGELNLYSTLDKRGIDDARNTLKQHGLIDFVKGERNKRNPSYKINYLSVNVGYKIVPNNVPNNVPNQVPNNVPNQVPNNVPNSVPKDAPFGININYAETENKQGIYGEEDDELQRELAGIREAFNDEVQGRQSEIVRSFRTHFGYIPTPSCVKFISEYVCRQKLSPDMTELAIDCAARANPQDPTSYIIAILRDWLQNGCTTVEQVDEYLYNRQ